MSDEEAIAAMEALHPGLILCAMEHCNEHVGGRLAKLGSLTNGWKEARDYFAGKFHRDPPAVHDWLLCWFKRFAALGGDRLAFLAEMVGETVGTEGGRS